MADDLAGGTLLLSRKTDQGEERARRLSLRHPWQASNRVGWLASLTREGNALTEEEEQVSDGSIRVLSVDACWYIM